MRFFLTAGKINKLALDFLKQKNYNFILFILHKKKH